jgi:hypothetical protein
MIYKNINIALKMNLLFEVSTILSMYKSMKYGSHSLKTLAGLLFLRVSIVLVLFGSKMIKLIR